jgi:hypothetical protein
MTGWASGVSVGRPKYQLLALPSRLYLIHHEPSLARQIAMSVFPSPS